MAAASDADSTWAELGDLVDPITLEPLSSLSCPPFELRADAKQRSASDWSAKRLTLAFNLSLSHSLSLSLSLSLSRTFSPSLSRSQIMCGILALCPSTTVKCPDVKGGIDGSGMDWNM